MNDKEKKIRAEINVFLFEQELRVANPDVTNWSEEEIYKLIQKHKEDK